MSILCSESKTCQRKISHWQCREILSTTPMFKRLHGTLGSTPSKIPVLDNCSKSWFNYDWHDRILTMRRGEVSLTKAFSWKNFSGTQGFFPEPPLDFKQKFLKSQWRRKCLIPYTKRRKEISYLFILWCVLKFTNEFRSQNLEFFQFLKKSEGFLDFFTIILKYQYASSCSTCAIVM